MNRHLHHLVVLSVLFFFSLPTEAHAEKCWPADFYKTLTKQDAPLLTHAPPESAGIIRKQVALKGRFEPEMVNVQLGADETAELITFAPKKGKAMVFDGVEYIELPNSTAFRTLNQTTGEETEWLATRAVPNYKNHIKPNGTQGPEGYMSHVLLFKRAKNGKFVFEKTLLKSSPETKFFFEDPRISIIYGSTGKPHFFLSGTDYSPHVPGSDNLDVMNRFVELKVAKDGSIAPVKVDPVTGKPNFSDMSPAPQLREDGGYSYVDAKNGTITRTEDGGIAVRLRLRPDFNDPAIKKLANGNEWHYGEQVYVFKNWNDFRRYDWKHSLEDLFHPQNTSGAANRVRPQTAKELVRDVDLVEQYHDPRIMKEKGKGLGPGSIPVRTVRRGNKLFISNGVGAPEHYAGTIPKSMRDTFILKDGEVKFLAPDHEIRYFKHDGFVKRHYTASLKLFNDRLTKIEAYFADAIQPLTTRERGVTSGILDLQHTYPMGRTIVPGKAGRKATVRIYSGTSDANTSQYDMDLLKVLMEMSEGSERRATGQVYTISR